jgi:hypothetical protein
MHLSLRLKEDNFARIFGKYQISLFNVLIFSCSMVVLLQRKLEGGEYIIKWRIRVKKSDNLVVQSKI